MARNDYAHTIDGSRKVRLARFDPSDTAGLEKEEGAARLAKLGDELSELSNLLAYAGQHALLVIVQGVDASGKDGSIRKILEFSNVLNASVSAFKAPTPEEKAHDFLWRVHARTPGKGHLALFNRSQYEDVIAARVHRLVPKAVWKGRYADINAFEKIVADSGTIVLKFCLHIGREKQHERLLEREADPRTSWKLNVGDWQELPLWKDTQKAYEDALERCSSPALPWYLVPADTKWFRNLAIIERLVLALRPYRAGWLDHLERLRLAELPKIREIRDRLAQKGKGKGKGKPAKEAK